MPRNGAVMIGPAVRRSVYPRPPGAGWATPFYGRFLFALWLLALWCGPGLAAGRPNIVILLCDDLGYGDLSCFAHPVIRTPHLDQLAREGVKLTHCYAS